MFRYMYRFWLYVVLYVLLYGLLSVLIYGSGDGALPLSLGIVIVNLGHP
jgi:hypothetical protein